MKKQLISLNTTGGATSLRQKEGQGIRLETKGKASITRVSEIEFDEDVQKFFIVFLNKKSPFSGIVTSFYKNCLDLLGLCKTRHYEGFQTLFFDTYEDAVESEVSIINSLRKEYGSEII